ncbi:MAG TPA: TldD/PmbA family protein [Bdellovibrionota bacterium]|nr:TldD/PmbA family protein [Bdellovibrionota bacterium]
MAIQRAPFPSDLQELRNTLVQLVPILEAKPDWYGSAFFERKASKNLWANLKQTQMADQVSAGVVLRIYDGYTLFEQATDELSSDALRGLAREFAERVAANAVTEGAVKRPYKGVSWKERLSEKLESEISSQIPAGVTAETPVHFGIRFEKNPVVSTPADTFAGLRALIDRCRELAPASGLSAEDLTYVLARRNFSVEESIFVDRQTNMSQTLYRLAMTVVTMSGPDRTFVRLGGLGGLEVVDVKDEEIKGLLTNLAALKKAERLSPGKYRVLFGPVLTGVLAHEAFGHSQEADTCARGRSKAWDLHKSGETVGNQHATILNNPAIFENAEGKYAAWGSYFFDEEGWLAREQVLLDRGLLKAPMTNLTSAIRLGVPRTANGKRESWANGVYTRQTNTYFSPGDRTLEQLMSELGDGFIALHAAGGMEDPKGMGIQVGISYLEEVRSGRRTGRLYKGPAGGDIQMTGYTPDVLDSIVAKSKIDVEKPGPDSSRHPFNDAGGCGKYHKEFVYAGCGGPFVLLDGVTLG